MALDLVLEDARIVDRLMSEYGAKRVNNVEIKFFCLLHEDKKTPSATWNTEKHCGHCFGSGCGEKWNVKRMLEILDMVPEDRTNGKIRSVEVGRYTYFVPRDVGGGWRIQYQTRKFRPGWDGGRRASIRSILVPALNPNPNGKSRTAIPLVLVETRKSATAQR